MPPDILELPEICKKKKNKLFLINFIKVNIIYLKEGNNKERKINKMEEKIDFSSIEGKPVFYYIRGKNKEPFITICILKQDNKLRRGIAICSSTEPTSKEYGRNQSFERAMYPVSKDNHENKIQSERVLRSIAKFVGLDLKKNQLSMAMEYVPFNVKSAIITENELTKQEKEILKKIN